MVLRVVSGRGKTGTPSASVPGGPVKPGNRFQGEKAGRQEVRNQEGVFGCLLLFPMKVLVGEFWSTCRLESEKSAPKVRSGRPAQAGWALVTGRQNPEIQRVAPPS